MPRLEPGAVFAGDYVVARLLGEGGMGAVYEVEQKSTGARRALKVMQPSLGRDPKASARFEQEARIGARIESDHVVEVLAAGIDSTTESPWLVMELLDGEDLGAHVARAGKLAVSDARGVLEQLCHALGAAHAAGVVHRDLKPENVFLARVKQVGVSSKVKVLDFGIAKLVAETRAATTQAIGTPLWMAPEQTQAGKRIKPATDVWSLGLLAYWLLTGKYYWQTANQDDTTAMALMKEVLFDPLAPATERAGKRKRSLPSGFDEWFGRCACREMDQRFPDAAAAWAGLESVLSSATPKGSTMPMVAPTARTEPMTTAPMGAVTAAALARTEPAPAPVSVSSPRRVKPIYVAGTLGAVAVVVIALATRGPTAPEKVPPSAAPLEPAPAPSVAPTPADPTVEICFEVTPPDARIEIGGMAVTESCIQLPRGRKQKAIVTKPGYVKQEKAFETDRPGKVSVTLVKTGACPKGEKLVGGRCTVGGLIAF
ncbi:MAG: serine/threonine-protein kinase [Polyangiaceae bacterium]